MEQKNHKLVIEIIRNTDEVLPYARAMYPEADVKEALSRMALEELAKASNEEIFEHISAKVVDLHEDLDTDYKKDLKSGAILIESQKLAKAILSSNSLTEEIRTAALNIFAKSNEILPRSITINAPGTSLFHEISIEDHKEITDLIKSDRKIPAIKRLRELTEWGLKDSKFCIDQWS